MKYSLDSDFSPCGSQNKSIEMHDQPEPYAHISLNFQTELEGDLNGLYVGGGVLFPCAELDELEYEIAFNGKPVIIKIKSKPVTTDRGTLAESTVGTMYNVPTSMVRMNDFTAFENTLHNSLLSDNERVIDFKMTYSNKMVSLHLDVVEKNVLDILESYKIQYDPKIDNYTIDEAKLDVVDKKDSLTAVNQDQSKMMQALTTHIVENMDQTNQDNSGKLKEIVNDSKTDLLI
jgi:hypothetical protein